MPIPVLSVFVIIFILWLQYEIRKSSKKSEAASDSFWEKDRKSNLARKSDISDLNYITLHPEQLPLSDNEDDTINSYRDTILDLANKKILNLAGYTNIDLKNRYGAANLPQLQDYDNNYTILVSILQKWATRHYHKGELKEAKAILEYALSIGSDVTSTYKLLAEIYRKEETPEKIDALIQKVSELKIYDKEKLITELNALKASRPIL